MMHGFKRDGTTRLVRLVQGDDKLGAEGRGKLDANLFVDIFRDPHIDEIQLSSFLWVRKWKVAHQGHLERQSRSMRWWVNGQNRRAACLGPCDRVSVPRLTALLTPHFLNKKCIFFLRQDFA